MTASNGIRTEHKIKRLAAAVALAIAAMLAAASLSPARADAAGTSDGNIVIDVPTTVPCALMADGTVVSPSEWKITTSGDAYIASASASGFPANVEWSARTTDLAAGQAGSVQVSATGNAVSVAGPSDPADAALAGTARFEWSFSKLDAGKNADVVGKAAGGTAVLGSVTFTFAKTEPDSFAVYSADDNSLSFYKRSSVPAPGDAFEGKTATEVYEGVEKASYTATEGAPWSGHAADIASVTVADAGVSPVSTAYWFKGASKLKSVSLAGLDTSQTTCMDGMFEGCSSLETLDLSAMSTRRVASMTAFLGGCESLAELSIGSEFAWIGEDCYPPTGDWKQGSTGTDYAESDIPTNKPDKYTRTKTAFAVYSADDQSLTFYKRFATPAAGGVFEGKTATGVYTGFETQQFDGYLSNVPWLSYQSNVKTVTVADEGIAPVSTANWFYSFTNVESINLSKLDTRNVTSMYCMFRGCKTLTTLDVSSFSTANVKNMGSMFDGCSALTSLDLSSFDTTNVTNMRSMFFDCKALTALGVSSFATEKVTNMYGMFYNCGSLTSLDVSHFDTSNATNMSNMFYGCAALPALDVLSFDTDKVTDMGSMFYGCKTLTTLDVSSFSTANVTNMSWMFNECKALTALDLSSFSTENVTNMGYMFRLCPKLQKVTFGADWKWVGTSGYLPTPSSTYIAGAAGKWYDTEGNGYAPKDIPSSKAMTYTAIAPEKTFAVYSADDQSLTFYKRVNVPSAGEQFEGKTATAVFTGIETNEYYDDNPWCNYTDEIKTASVVDEGIAPVSTAYWFTSCKNLTTADLTKLDTSNVTRMTEMFHFCSSLAKLEGISSWNTSKVVSMSSMFDLCPLTSLDLSNWDTSNVEYMQSMFSSCSSLTSVGDISSWDTSKVTSISDMFTGCSKLSASCLNWDVSKVTNHRDFNKNATGVTVPLAWQASSDEGGEDPAIALLCEEQGNGNALSVPSGTTKAEAASKTEGKPLADNETEGGNTASADVEGATQKDAMGKQQLGETALKESDASSELDGVEKNAEAKPAVEDEATKEDVSATEPEGIEKAVVKKSGE